jgi:diacylglycerol kinase (ATP)
MAKRQPGGFQRIINATGYSLAGLKAAWRDEAAFRQEVLLLAVLLPAALWLGSDMIQRTLLIGSLLLVLIVELLNSAVEAAIDRIGPERHALSGRAKDFGSAAVMISLMGAALTWAAIAWERFT